MSRFAKPTWRSVAPNGFHIYLHAASRRGRVAITAGVQYLLWATGTESDLQEFAQRLRARPCGLPPHRKRSDRH